MRDAAGVSGLSDRAAAGALRGVEDAAALVGGEGAVASGCEGCVAAFRSAEGTSALAGEEGASALYGGDGAGAASRCALLLPSSL